MQSGSMQLSLNRKQPILLSIEDRELVKARAWRDIAPEVAVELASLFLAFFPRDFVKSDAVDLLVHRGLSVAEATAIVLRVQRFIGE